MSDELKELVSEVRRIVTQIYKWPKWKIKIQGTTKMGNNFDYEVSWPIKGK